MIPRLLRVVLALLPLSFSLHAQQPPAVETGPEIEVQVNVLGNAGGKFDKQNITREENKVIQAPFAGGPGNSIQAVVAKQPEGAIYIAGTLAGMPAAKLPFTKASSARGDAFVAKLSADARRMEAIVRLPETFVAGTRLALSPDGSVVVAGKKVAAKGGEEQLMVARLNPDLNAVLWSRAVVGDNVASVSVGPDNSVVVSPDSKPFVSRIAADGSKLIPFGKSETFRTDGGNPDVYQAWWVGCGFQAAGYPGGANYHRGGNAGVQALPDGTFVLFTTNATTHPGGGPDFDGMLMRFDASGKILWTTHLLDALPAESDHKNPTMALDPHTGDLLLTSIQHGHFKHNLLFTPGAYQNPHPYLTGNIMIGWLARVNPATGKPKAATYFFPEMPGPLVGGKKRANSLFPTAITAGPDGVIYVVGASAFKFETTLHAFQSSGNSGGFIAAFTPDLGRLLYASLIEAPGFSFTPSGIALGKGGPVTVGNYAVQKNARPAFEAANADVTNYLLPRPNGLKGGFLNFTPSGPWLQ